MRNKKPGVKPETKKSESTADQTAHSPAAVGMLTDLPLSEVDTGKGIQCRIGINSNIVEEYASAMRDNAEFPPVNVYKIDGQWIIADGHHRVLAARRAGKSTITAIVYEGISSGSRKNSAIWMLITS